MSKKELTKHHIIKMACNGQLTVAQAAARLNLGDRRIKQLKKAFRRDGPAAFIHGNRKRTSSKRIHPDIVNAILALRKDDVLEKANFTHFHEILTQRYQMTISYSALYRILKTNGFDSPKSRRRKKVMHPTRERKPAFGVMLQADGSPHDWLGIGEKWTLHGFIDDATSRVTGLYLCKNECLLGYNEVLRQTLTRFGIPQSLYPDMFSVFFVNEKRNPPTIEEQLAGYEKRLTQFGRIIEHLGIDMFPARSPQAKGRIERLWNTLQQRLPVEMQLAGIKTMADANTFLSAYLERFNEQFGVPPKESWSGFVPLPAHYDLDRLLCVEFERSLSHGSTISIQGKQFLIKQNQFPAKTKVTVLIDEKNGLRASIHGHFFPILPLGDKPENKASNWAVVLTDLVQHYLLQDAKRMPPSAATTRQGVKYSRDS